MKHAKKRAVSPRVDSEWASEWRPASWACRQATRTMAKRCTKGGMRRDGR